MNEVNDNPVKTARARHWFRFRLRTMLVMVTLLTAPLGWVGLELDQRRKEKSTIAWVVEKGGEADPPNMKRDNKTSWEKTKDKWFGGQVSVVVFFDGTKVNDLSPLAELKNLELLLLNKGDHVTDLTPLEELKNLRWLKLQGIQDCDLAPLAKLSNLMDLDLRRTKVTDLSPLAQLQNLNSLNLNGTQVSDFSPLAKMKNLKTLQLMGTNLSDLSPIAELKNLEVLYLVDTQLSDLSPLAELNNLKVLQLDSNQASEERVQEIRLTHPNVNVVINRPGDSVLSY